MSKNIFKNKNFMLLLSGNAVSQLGNWLFYLSLIYYVSDKTGSLTIAGVMLAVNILPIIFFSPLAGGVSDKYSRRGILVVSDFLNGFCSLYLGYRAFMNKLGLIEVLVLTFFIGVGTTFFNPAFRSSIPNVVEKEQLARANSLVKITSAITGILGPLVGGILITTIGAPLAFLINGISFVVSGLTECFIIIPQQVSESMRSSSKVFQNFINGIKFIQRHHFIKVLLLLFSIMTFVAAPIMLYLKVLTANYYSGIPIYMTMIIVADAIGVLVASVYITYNPMEKYHRILIAVFPMFCGLALLVLGNVPILYVAILAMFIQGLISGFGDIAMATLLQSETPDENRGSVMSTFSMVLSSLAPISFLVSGYLIDVLGVRLLLTVNGLVLVMCSLLMLLDLRRGPKSIKR